MCRLFQISVVTCLLVVALTTPTAAQIKGVEAFGYVTGKAFVSMDQTRKTDYAAGLADQLVGLFQAQLTDGFRWFETCARANDAAAMAEMLTTFLIANPARLPEPAANNFIWAVAKGCAANK